MHLVQMCLYKSVCCHGQYWQAYSHHCHTSRWPHCFGCVPPHSHRQVPRSEAHWDWRSTQTYNRSQDGGCEAATKQIFLDQGTEAALLVDATNAFYFINRHSALHKHNCFVPLSRTSTHQYILVSCSFIHNRQWRNPIH